MFPHGRFRNNQQPTTNNQHTITTTHNTEHTTHHTTTNNQYPTSNTQHTTHTTHNNTITTTQQQQKFRPVCDLCFALLSIRDFMLASVRDANATAAARRRQRRLRQFLLHGRLSVAMALVEMQHDTAPRGQMTARAGEELNYTATVRTHPPPQAASTVSYTFGDDEEVLAAGVRPAPLSEVAGPQERVQRHTVEQIVDFVPVVQILDAPVSQMGASIPAVLEQVIVPSLPEVRFMERVARVRAPLVAVPGLAVPPTALRDHSDAALEFEEDEEEDEGVEEEEELEMFDESINRFPSSCSSCSWFFFDATPRICPFC